MEDAVEQLDRLARSVGECTRCERLVASRLRAVPAQAAGAIDVGPRLAGELRQPTAKYVSLEFDELNVVLAPFGDELMLVLVGTPSALICEYRLNPAGP